MNWSLIASILLIIAVLTSRKLRTYVFFSLFIAFQYTLLGLLGWGAFRLLIAIMSSPVSSLLPTPLIAQ